jgi:hypothetical protein
LSWGEYRESAGVAVPLERDAVLKRALGFDEATFTRAGTVLRGVVDGHVTFKP